MASEINGSRSHVPDYYVDETGTSYRLVYDNLGSLRLIVRVSNGLTVGIMEHDEFGVKIKDTTGSVVPFGFAGGLFEPYSRLVHFGAREYSPFDGRWLTKDPIGFEGGDTNLYGYVANDPVNWTDPSGLDRRICSRRIRHTPGMVGPVRHDFVEFRDSKGNTTIKSFGPNGAIQEDPNSSENSCPAYSKSSEKADKAAEDLADTLTDLVDYNLMGFNCQDFSRNVFNFQNGR